MIKTTDGIFPCKCASQLGNNQDGVTKQPQGYMTQWANAIAFSLMTCILVSFIKNSLFQKCEGFILAVMHWFYLMKIKLTALKADPQSQLNCSRVSFTKLCQWTRQSFADIPFILVSTKAAIKRKSVNVFM